MINGSKSSHLRMHIYAVICFLLCAIEKSSAEESFTDEKFLMSQCNAGDRNSCESIIELYQYKLISEDCIINMENLCKKEYSDACFILYFVYAWPVIDSVADLEFSMVKCDRQDDIEKGKQYLELSCEQGHLTACDQIGDGYEYGKNGYPKDPAKSIHYEIKSCDNGNGITCALLGFYYLDKVKDKSEAFKYFSMSCNIPESRQKSCFTIALMHEQGVGTEKNLQKAISVHEENCNINESQRSCQHLGVIYRDKIKDTPKSKAYFQKACEYGDEDSCSLK